MHKLFVQLFVLYALWIVATLRCGAKYKSRLQVINDNVEAIT